MPKVPLGSRRNPGEGSDQVDVEPYDAQAEIERSVNLQDKLASLDGKLDKLSVQVAECLATMTCLMRQNRRLSECGMVLSSYEGARSGDFVNTRILPSCDSRNSEATASYSPGGISPAGSKRRVSRLSHESAMMRYESDDKLGRCSRVSLDSIASWIIQRQRRQGCFQQQVWNFLDNPETSLAASIYNRVMPFFILSTVLFSLVQSMDTTIGPMTLVQAVEISIESIFMVEISTRFIVCPNRWMFFGNSYNLIDVVSVLPLGLRVVLLSFNDLPALASFRQIAIMSFVPVLRLLKALRRFQTFHLLTKAFVLASEAVPVLLYFYLSVWLCFSAVIYAVEERDNIENFTDAMWLTFVSMTTVGYGDKTPKSVWGRVVVATLVVSCTLYMAIPIGIIGSCFSEVWNDRDRILMVQRLRSCLVQNGFNAEDIPKIFAEFDTDQTGTLNLIKFRRMAEMLKLGLSEARVLALFQLFDDDRSGVIDDRAFVRKLFPGAYHLLFSTDRPHPGGRLSARWLKSLLAC